MHVQEVLVLSKMAWADMPSASLTTLLQNKYGSTHIQLGPHQKYLHYEQNMVEHWTSCLYYMLYKSIYPLSLPPTLDIWIDNSEVVRRGNKKVPKLGIKTTDT